MIHPPKVERFDLRAMTNTDPKGIVREVETYRAEPFGLYLARPTPGRAQFHYLESWLLPQLGLRITDFHYNPGHDVEDRSDFYLDVVEITREGEVWRTQDLYLDITLQNQQRAEVLDVDELLEALLHGELTQEAGESALRTAFSTVRKLAEHGYDLADWLATHKITLSWQRWPDVAR